MGNKLRPVILESVFRLKGNFAPGVRVAPRCFGDVEITPFRGGVPASATISADFELSWAWRGWRSTEETRLRAAQERSNVLYLVRLLEEYEVPITWATVGHLFLEHCCRGIDGMAHSQMLRPIMTTPPGMARWTGDWYSHDPCTDYCSDPLWYCPDLIATILGSKVRHELASHSFSHISFLPENSTHELVEEEIGQCQAAMAHFGVQARSLVYPYNQMGHDYAPLLAQLGLTCVRHRDPAVRLSYPERLPSGVYKVYESMNLRRPRHYNYIDKVRMFLDEAIRRQAAYHVWFHPSDPEDLFQHEFRQIVKELAARRRGGQLWVTTMAELAAYCEAREQIQLEARRHTHGLTITLQSNYDAKRYGQTKLTLRVASELPPSVCLVQTQNRCEPVKWKNEGRHRETDGRVSFLIDVPTDAHQVLITFKPRYESREERSTAIASSAFG